MDTPVKKHIALIAHDHKKPDMLEWCSRHLEFLKQHVLYATGTTGHLLKEQLDLTIECLQSGPLGGDAQIGARITEGTINFMVFFWDPLAAQPHDPDVRSLLRLAVLWNIPMACNPATADYLVVTQQP